MISAQSQRDQTFNDHEPALTKIEAHVAYANGEVALSLTSLPCLGDTGTIEYLAVKFALQNGASAMILIDRLAATALRMLIEDADSVQWDGNALRAALTAH